MITADSLTEEQIGSAWKTGELSGEELMAALGHARPWGVPSADAVRKVRARCAALLNARVATKDK